eukprot:COSAG06_NODE_41762_length_388_cov_0.709343_2_plen_32_part_01
MDLLHLHESQLLSKLASFELLHYSNALPHASR